MRIFCALAATLIGGTSLPATADEAWVVYNDTTRQRIAAAACPFEDDAGHFYCVALDCAPGGPLEITVMIAGGGPSTDAFPGIFAVDGRSFAAFSFQRTAQDDYLEFRGAYDPARHGGLIAALQSGSLGLLILDPAGEKLGQTILLGGAGPAIDTALQGCAPQVTAELANSTPPRVAQPAAALPAPVARAQAEILADCGQGTQFGPEFVQQHDFDGDGILDVLMRYEAVQCAAIASMYCGSGGCGHRLHRGLPGGAFDDGVYFTAYSATVTENPPGLALETHGSTCGLTGAAGPCVQRLIWQNGSLTTLPGN